MISKRDHLDFGHNSPYPVLMWLLTHPLSGHTSDLEDPNHGMTGNRLRILDLVRSLASKYASAEVASAKCLRSPSLRILSKLVRIMKLAASNSTSKIDPAPFKPCLPLFAVRFLRGLEAGIIDRLLAPRDRSRKGCGTRSAVRLLIP